VKVDWRAHTTIEKCSPILDLARFISIVSKIHSIVLFLLLYLGRDPKICGPKILSVQNYFLSKKCLGKKILCPKNVWVKKIWGQKNYGSKKNLGPKKFGSKKVLGPNPLGF